MATKLASGTSGYLHTLPDCASDTIVTTGDTTAITGARTFTGVQSFVGGTGGAATAGLVLGGGTSATPATTSAANKNFVEFYTKTTATSGDSRGAYLRHYFAGAGVSGEALRAYGTVSNVSVASGGTVNGAHVTLNVTGASAAISGSANALRATLDYDTTPTTIGGTVSVIQCESNLATGPTVQATASFMRFNNLGVQGLPVLFNFVLPTATMIASAGTGANSAGLAGGGVAAKAIKCLVDGVAYWLPLFSSNS